VLELNTTNVAIWGAVTGTIGTLAGVANLYFRYKRHNNEKAILDCSSILEYESYAGRPRPKYKIVARSRGQRSVSIDFIKYYLRPEEFWPSLPALLKWRTNQWIYEQQLRHDRVTLDEGRKAEFVIKLPNTTLLKHISKAVVVDESGKEWKVSWPSQATRRKLDCNEELETIEKKNGSLWCKAECNIAGGEYWIVTSWSSKRNNLESTSFRHFPPVSG